MILVYTNSHVEYNIRMAQISVYLYFFHKISELFFAYLFFLIRKRFNGYVLSQPFAFIDFSKTSLADFFKFHNFLVLNETFSEILKLQILNHVALIFFFAFFFSFLFFLLFFFELNLMTMHFWILTIELDTFESVFFISGGIF